MDDFSRQNPDKAEPDDRLIPQTEVGPDPAGADQPFERLLGAEPAGRLRCLDLPVSARELPERIVPPHEHFQQCQIGRTLADAPTQEDANPREAAAHRVAGPNEPTPL